MTVPYAFGAATSAIPLSQLDDNFNTTITLGNTAIQLGNTVTTLNNMTLANVNISSGNVTITNVTVTTANATTVNTTTLIATTGNVTTVNATDVNVATSVTLNAGTANGVVYLNGSKVATSGSALTFDGTTFQYTGAANFATSSGNVGIGTSSPVYTLDVSSTGTSIGGRIQTNQSGAYLSFLDNGGLNGYVRVGSIDNSLVMLSGNNVNATLDSSGNLGLGVTPSAWGSNIRSINIGPGSSLTNANSFTQTWLASNAYYDTAWKYKNTAEASYYEQASGLHKWYTAASGTAGNAISFTQAMTLTANSELFINNTSGTTGSNGAKLDVRGGMSLSAASAVNGGYQELNFAAGIYTKAAIRGYSVSTTDAGELRFYTAPAGDVINERARITSGGYFKASDNGVYAGSGADYHELRTTGVSWTLYAQAANATAANCYGISLEYSAAAPNGTGNEFIKCYDNAATRAAIRSNGGLANYQSNNVDLSDIRTKTDINPLASYWNKIAALEIVTYKYKDQTHDDLNIGVIAQQVEQVAPEFVDPDGFGETPEDGVPLKTIYNKDLTFAAIKALQEAMARIEKLEAEVAALKGV